MFGSARVGKKKWQCSSEEPGGGGGLGQKSSQVGILRTSTSFKGSTLSCRKTRSNATSNGLDVLIARPSLLRTHEAIFINLGHGNSRGVAEALQRRCRGDRRKKPHKLFAFRCSWTATTWPECFFSCFILTGDVGAVRWIATCDSTGAARLQILTIDGLQRTAATA